MPKLSTKNTVFAVVKETTEGTPVAPSAATDFVAFQEGFSVTPSFTEITNAELQSSIGTPKSALGFEEPSASVSHYFRHSGVEGQAPNFGDLIESCLGDTSSNATERTTDAGSTTTAIELVAGGSDFARGKAVLLKDSVNGYSIRNVLSVSTDTLTLAQAAANAPAAGVNVGKCVNYAPANENHPTLDLWTYRANGGATELMAGTRVTDMTIDITAGDFINGSFTLSGIKYFFDPITITASNKYIDFDDAGGEENAVIAEKTYKDPYELAAAIQTAMDGLTADNITVTYDDATRKFTIVSDGASLSLLWLTGANTANSIGTTLGFLVAADDTGALTYTSDNAQDWSAAFTPEYDDSDPLVAKNNTILIGEGDEIVCFGAQSASISVSNTKTDVTDVCAESGKSGSQFTGRTVSIDVVAYLDQGQAEEFKRFRNNDEIYFTYNAGVKSGGNWVPGKAVNFFSPSCKISSFALGDGDGLVTLEMTLQCFVADGLGEFYINFL